VLVVPADDMDFQRDDAARQAIVDAVRESLKPAPVRYLRYPVHMP